MSTILYVNSTGELRIRLLDEDGDEVTTGMVTADLAKDGTLLFDDRAMAHSTTRKVTSDAAAGCWWCVVNATELTTVQGTYVATITAIDSSSNQLVVEKTISVIQNTG